MQVHAQRELATVHFLIDRAVSRFTVQAFATGLLSAFGHNPTIAIRDYEGEVGFVPGSYDEAFVRMNVKTSTLEVLDEMKRDDRQKLESTMYFEVLDVVHYPNAVYESNRISVRRVSDDLLNANIAGELTLRGITQTYTLDARVLDLGTMLRASGEFSLRQSDHGIKPVSLAGGALRLKDELKFTFEIVAKRQD